MHSRNHLDCLWSSVLPFQQIPGWLMSWLSQKGLLYYFLQIKQPVAGTYCNNTHIGLPVNPDPWSLSWFITCLQAESSKPFHCCPTKSATTLLAFSACFHPWQHCSHVSYPTTTLWSQWDYMAAAAHRQLWFPLFISHGVCISIWSFHRHPDMISQKRC